MIVGLVGFIGSGKNTVADLMCRNGDFHSDSYASALKDVCSVIFQWDRKMLEGDTTESRIFRETVDQWWENKLGIPGFTPRFALQHIGTDLFRNHFHQDIWTLIIERKYSDSKKNVVITDARFPNEIELIRKLGGKIVLVDKNATPEWYATAKKANEGDIDSLIKMEKRYPRVHRSEWAWIGTEFDYTIDNNWTMSRLCENVETFLKQI